VLCVPCFVLGYLLFAALSACIGAISSNAREGGQLAALYSLFPFVPLWCMSLVLLDPTNPLWIVLSIFPLTSPVMMIERIGIADLPAWQLAAGLGVLALCVTAALFVGTRIFRAWLLMYGKRPRLGEVMRSIWTE
jgi:ABC-2 type transport system permease protein